MPEDIDLDRPNPARVYDWLLGGEANWAVDREFGEQILQVTPHARAGAMVNREFLGRAVRYCVQQGITQFLDIGSGVPTVGNVHEVAQSLAPDSRCVYVDNEPVAVAHSKILLERHGDPERHAVLRGDLRDVRDVWKQALGTGVLDPDRPVGLLMVAVLHFIDEGAHEAVARYRELLPAGSHLVVSHGSYDGVPAEQLAQLERVIKQYQRSSAPAQGRSRDEVTAFFGDFDLVEPGVVWLPQWRPGEGESKATAQFLDNPSSSCVLGGVARKA
ncbi:SAM-dependent methyltransferase [Amycolatopsis aidingensis]|uniref:SAM-dependent methyltransferase n=1 Tax=Amycolatopsis aidingensis TaxID=2842453 RepID=UPI001C0B9547|nr:SAM-dependent methyltransferase [Amycolatopsis aidingensis]